MPQRNSVTVWTTAPERRIRDVVSANPAWSADGIRDVLQGALTALSVGGGDSGAPDLLLPPVKSFSPRRAAARKDLHHHRYVEIGIITRGEMTLWWDGVSTRCRAGCLFVIPPGMRYMPHVQDPKQTAPPHSVLWLALHRGSAIVHTCALEGREHRLSEYYCFTEPQVTAQARSLAQELAARATGYETVVRGSLLCLLTWLLRAPVYSISRTVGGARDRADAGRDAFQSRVEEYILSHYHRPVSLGQVADAVGCSPAYLCRRFRETAGQTPFQYLRAVRIEAAKRLLLSEVPIARVAEMVGFDDALYFSKVFSGQTGESPQSYRRRNA